MKTITKTAEIALEDLTNDFASDDMKMNIKSFVF